MDLSPGEIRGMAFVASRHPDKSLSANVVLENGIGYLRVAVWSGDPTGSTFYILSPTGRVWSSSNGHKKDEPDIRDADYEQPVFDYPAQHPHHVEELINHIAHLEEDQISKVRGTLVGWAADAVIRNRGTE